MKDTISVRNDYRPRTQFEIENDVPAIIRVPEKIKLKSYGGKTLRNYHLSSVYNESSISKRELIPDKPISSSTLKRWNLEDLK